MRIPRFACYLACFVTLFLPAAQAQDKFDKLTIRGKLTRIMAIGAETSGWAIEVDPPIDVHGKQVSSIEVVALDSKKLEELATKTVKATGILSNVTGIETGQRPVLNLTSIKAVKDKTTK